MIINFYFQPHQLPAKSTIPKGTKKVSADNQEMEVTSLNKKKLKMKKFCPKIVFKVICSFNLNRGHFFDNNSFKIPITLSLSILFSETNHCECRISVQESFIISQG